MSTTTCAGFQVPLNYVALGDSLTVGVGSAIFTPGFVGDYTLLSQSALCAPICPRVFAKIGATTDEILQSLSIPEVAYHISHADIITLTAGGNDLIHAAEAFLVNHKVQDLETAVNQSTANISKIICKIHELNPPEKHTYILRILDLYNPFPNISETRPWIHAFNTHLASFSSMPHIGIANIYSPFEGRQKELLSSDHVHPNPKGYKVMAEATYRLGYDHLLRKTLPQTG